ncbi:LysR family transcriptional regulator [Photobacterium angustum]|uniref:LysR family transcriptional regulator n=1 Tax=Photobacterium angustum TaxID=661 RepID=UPI0005E87025|nr:LysR family transcriptional regulator [Photobacterium angustum]KJG03142.1 LysR family transcriptional regulator [Photobacterium angustum]KJG24592.1 LysR family transcriptional regulator [Photobacterium angustum]PSV66270.1 LysR family transcriptional regulator [Photobacterium angustum]PSW97333.1 LysR family transcriptional regulator [Photobacterium angustum]PSX00667.1 LysR family transcriptional regulator [Photobacterium angustum]
MDIDALRSFLAFVETGSFTRVAKQSFRTQSAISMQMKKLEDELNTQLFTKDGRMLVLTEDGQRLATHATQIIATHDEALLELKNKLPQQTIHLGCPDDYAESILPYIVALLREEHPHISLQITCAPSVHLKGLLDSNRLDLAIVTRSPTSQEGYFLQTDKGIWVGSPHHDIVNQQPLPIVLFQRDCKFHGAAIEGLIKRNRHYQLVSCCSSATANKGLVRQGLAISAMAKCSMPNDLIELTAPHLPSLPVVDIVLSLPSKPHLLLSPESINRMIDRYQCDQFATEKC